MFNVISLIVVVLATAVEMSTVTVVPAPMTTAVHELGTTPGLQVPIEDQELESTLVTVPQ